ncbi:MAG TPA: molybdenum cofactor guanylyltransferase [Gaiellaceae bacterium]|nr:molybdenum cofactor guanylyltransferase [Gaiellaceae bacterium]
MSASRSSSAGEIPARSAIRSRASESQGSITGILLVGGASRRFGSPKALARLGTQTLAERAWSALAWCDERIALGKPGGPQLPFAVRDDGIDVQAPIAGVVAGLRAARFETCVFLPVDVPLVGEQELRRLAAECREAAVPQTGPLPGAYRRSALPVLERHLEAGGLALYRAVEELDVVRVSIDEQLLANVNTPRDLRALEDVRPRARRSGSPRAPRAGPA